MYLLCLLDLNMLEAGLPKQWSLDCVCGFEIFDVSKQDHRIFDRSVAVKQSFFFVFSISIFSGLFSVWMLVETSADELGKHSDF